MNEQNKANRRLFTFGTNQFPASSDPLDFDLYAHHYAFSSVYAKLVSKEIKNSYLPTVASNWISDNNFQKWSFILNENLFYSNGDSIKPQDILLNFNRIAYLKKQKNSNSGFLEYVQGFKDEFSIASGLKGLTIENNKITFNFVKPIPNLLDLISFGFYGIAHPSLFNNSNGIWLKEAKHISSGAYEIEEWNKDFFRLKIRKDIPYVEYKNSIESIEFVLVTNIKEKKDLDVIDMLTAPDNSLLVDDRFTFISSDINLKISYVEIYKWQSGNLSKIENRRWLRKLFLDGLESNQFKITNSFLPHNLKNLKPFSMEYDIPKPISLPSEISTHPINFAGKLKELNHKQSIADFLQSAMENIQKDGDIKLIQNFEENYLDYDLSINSTGIESEDYIDTLRFMFFSKDGIQLPDETGAILRELKKDNPDVNFINQELWNQAIIWPITHYTGGFWVKANNDIDYSAFNANSPAIDFQFLKWK